MIHFSLFSGIGGFELASEWVGWNNYLSCDINEFGNKILSYYWPEAYHHKDIHTLNNQVIDHELTKRYGSQWRSDDIILTGGFPFQPYSAAGKRLGKEDDRHLWPEMLRVIRDVQPTWVVGENVLGLVNWNDGLVFNEVQADLEAEGYEVQAFVLPAASVNAPHKRDRVWFIAYSSRFRWRRRNEQSESDRNKERKMDQNIKQYGNGIWSKTQRCSEASPDSSSFGCNDRSDNWQERYVSDDERITEKSKSEWQGRKRGSCEISTTTSNSDSDGMQRHTVNIRAGQKDGQRRQSTEKTWNHEPIRAWQNFPTQSPICGGDDGLPNELDGITFSKWRNESIKAYGNAIVPQVAYQIFKAINEYNDL
jgi:DNA (cytosine-5)-methyltransferase 1